MQISELGVVPEFMAFVAMKMPIMTIAVRMKMEAAFAFETLASSRKTPDVKTVGTTIHTKRERRVP
jgi:hypothetical protein